MSAIAYLTDVEGQWHKLEGFCRDNPYVSLDAEGRLSVAEGAVFVFGGDAIDRGPSGRRIVATFLEAARRMPERVVLLAGNRDINKMRLVRELGGEPPERTPPELRSGPRGALLRWLFAHTMGARAAADHRATELAASGAAADDEAVVASILEDFAPDGLMTAYLGVCRLAYRHGENLFVHGGIGPEAFGAVPGASERLRDVDAWVAALEAFYRAQVASFRARAREPSGRASYEPLIVYQAPLPGHRDNPGSVVYARPSDREDNPLLPDAAVVAGLGASGVTRLVLGHTPSGDCPAVLRDGAGFEVVFGDNSYGRHEEGAQVLLDDDPRLAGETVLDDGTRARVAVALADAGPVSPLGLCDAETGALVKARLASGAYLCYRSHAGRRVEQRAVSAAELARRPLVAPRAREDGKRRDPRAGAIETPSQEPDHRDRHA
ncbi:MAG: hypothetical protein HY908_16315 [Myxococcales bacterium]|nr:hypothetical protein [Myxococcales bacterium]